MPVQVKVNEGDYIASLAYQAGFAHASTIWDYPDNAALKQLRVNPNILNPGDLVTIPDRHTKDVERPIDQRHRFRLSIDRLYLRVILENRYGNPLPGAVYELQFDTPATASPTSSAAAGRVDAPLHPAAQEALIKMSPGDYGIYSGQVVQLDIGCLDPLRELSGQIARLTNLGYDAGPLDGTDPMRLRSAIEEFQCENHLAVDGVCGPQTLAKLKEVYGC